MLELAAQAADPLTMGATALGLVLASFFSGLAIERRRNGRRNNPGNPDDYRYGGKRGSDCKPGHGKICEKHGEKLEAQGGAIERLGAYQETFEKNQSAIWEQLNDIQGNVTTLVARQDMPHKGP